MTTWWLTLKRPLTPCCLGLADSEKKRAESYAAWVKETIVAEEWELIRKSLQRGQLTGSPRLWTKSVPFFKRLLMSPHYE